MQKNAKKVLVMLGHPDTDSLAGFLADQYEAGAKEGGHEVKRVNVGDLKFDPILHKGYRVIQELEPDLVMTQEAIKWANHIVLIYPNWWGSMPALLKGFFDRALLPGFGFNFHECKIIKRLAGKSARVIITMDIMPTLFFHTRTAVTMKNSILGFCGIDPVRITEIGPVKDVVDEKKDEWGKRVFKYGEAGI
jgi:putative NADPH-quinone reductase